MTKQELEKAIEKGESVWINGIEHKLDKYYFVAEYNNEPTLYLMACGYEEDDWNNYPVEAITNIYKTKAEAEHYLHHANITRTEHLPFLTWKEFLKKEYVEFFNGGKGFRLYISYINCDHIRISKYDRYNPDGDVIFETPLTEQNFYIAYDECVKLFKGE